MDKVKIKREYRNVLRQYRENIEFLKKTDNLIFHTKENLNNYFISKKIEKSIEPIFNTQYDLYNKYLYERKALHIKIKNLKTQLKMYHQSLCV